MTTFERVVERLKEEPFLADYTFRKRDSSFIKKFDGGLKRINLYHWFNIVEAGVCPIFSVRHDIIFKWFDKFSFRRYEDRRDDYLVAFTARMLGLGNSEFYFKVSLDNFESEYARLAYTLKKGSEEVFSQWATLEDFYKKRIVPELEGKEPFPYSGADWMFQYLTVCRIVAPERYEELKAKCLEQAEWFMTRENGPEPNMLQYYDRLNEILGYLESLNLEKMMELNGKKVILKQ